MNTLPSQTLRDLIVRYGRALYDDPRRLEALLRDYCGTYRQEISVLTGAARERIPPDLLASISTMPLEIAIAQQTKRLQTNLGLAEDSARWSVQSWAFALGLISEIEITASISSSSSHQPPPVPNQYQCEAIAPSPSPIVPQPVILQTQPPQLTTPLPINRSIEYANFWKRTFAFLIDTIIAFLVAFFLIGIYSDEVYGSSSIPDADNASLGALFLIIWCSVQWLYSAFMECFTARATIGKLALGIQVITLRHQKISFVRAMMRNSLKFFFLFLVMAALTQGLQLSGGLLFVRLLFLCSWCSWLGKFNDKNQPSYDRLTHCLVVKKDK